MLKIEIDPYFKRIYITRPGRVCRGYRHSVNRAIRLFNLANRMGLNWSNPKQVTTFTN